MKHHHHDDHTGFGRDFHLSHHRHHHPEAEDHRGRHGGHRRGGRPGGRLFDYGELRLLILAMLAEGPSHGYELIKAIEERFAGSYSPSPGVIYPTLAWLEDMGYASVEPAPGNRKSYRVTPEGEAFLVANRAAADDLLSRAAQAAGMGGGRPPMPPPVERAMENLKLAMRLRFRAGTLDAASAEAIANALDEAAKAVERS
ncbi:PadR family transcriptional regulator [Aureimonas sp. AU12]|uniref:PadR family transcriptional regulator n=1 Tax=Aureimonas sp. AU12 TaxID=1638161 RepID=UPI0009EB8E28|nr:PadR family transcriptional regulator [Aureimonas sp. AU12]